MQCLQVLCRTQAAERHEPSVYRVKYSATASLNSRYGVAADWNGNVYIADTYNNRQ
jgi:hypothetical protein